MSVEESRAYFLGSDEGEAIWLLGGLYTFKALGEQNGDQYTVVEVSGPGGARGLAAPLHFHEREDEGFYIVEGEITLVIGDETSRPLPARSPSRRATPSTPSSWNPPRRRCSCSSRLEPPDTRGCSGRWASRRRPP